MPRPEAPTTLTSFEETRPATGYEQPAMDPAIREELDAFVEKRKAEGGAPTDF